MGSLLLALEVFSNAGISDTQRHTRGAYQQQWKKRALWLQFLFNQVLDFVRNRKALAREYIDLLNQEINQLRGQAFRILPLLSLVYYI